MLLVKGEVIALYIDIPQPYKLLDLPDPKLRVEVRDGKVMLNVEKPAKGVRVPVQGDDEGIEFGENSLDLFPGDEVVVKAKKLKGRVVTVASLWNPKATRASTRLEIKECSRMRNDVSHLQRFRLTPLSDR
jgi:beta-mannosidase